MNNQENKPSLVTEVVFSINTTRDYFIDWLAEKILLKTNPKIKGLLEKQPNKRFSDLLAQSRFHPEEQIPIIINIANDPKDKIILSITTIGRNRIEVEATYVGNSLKPFLEILIMIVKTFNESGEPIVHYLEKKLLPDHFTINSSDIEKISFNSENIQNSTIVIGNNNEIKIISSSDHQGKLEKDENEAL